MCCRPQSHDSAINKEPCYAHGVLYNGLHKAFDTSIFTLRILMSCLSFVCAIMTCQRKQAFQLQ